MALEADVHVQSNKDGPLPPALHKNELYMNHRRKYKDENCNSLRRKYNTFLCS